MTQKKTKRFYLSLSIIRYDKNKKEKHEKTNNNININIINVFNGTK
jgi:hypothetical protein